MKKDLEELVKNIAERLGYYLVEMTVDERRRRVTIIIHKKTGITLHDCEIMTHELNDDMEFSERYIGRYDIEVSSPGVEREFKKFEEYTIFEGREVKIITEGGEGETTIIGVLKGTTPQHEVVVERNLKTYKIPYNKIKKGQMIFNF